MAWKLLIPLLATVAAATAASPPTTEVQPVRETLHGVEIVDPYRWLEGSAGLETAKADAALDARVAAWTDAQNAYGRSVLDGLPGRKEIEIAPALAAGRRRARGRLPARGPGLLHRDRGGPAAAGPAGVAGRRRPPRPPRSRRGRSERPHHPRLVRAQPGRPARGLRPVQGRRRERDALSRRDRDRDLAGGRDRRQDARGRVAAGRLRLPLQPARRSQEPVLPSRAVPPRRHPPPAGPHAAGAGPGRRGSQELGPFCPSQPRRPLGRGGPLAGQRRQRPLGAGFPGVAADRPGRAPADRGRKAGPERPAGHLPQGGPHRGRHPLHDHHPGRAQQAGGGRRPPRSRAGEMAGDHCRAQGRRPPDPPAGPRAPRRGVPEERRHPGRAFRAGRPAEGRACAAGPRHRLRPARAGPDGGVPLLHQLQRAGDPLPGGPRHG